MNKSLKIFLSVLFLLVAGSFFSVPKAHAGTLGPTLPGSTTQRSIGSAVWSNTDNIKVEDEAFATATTNGAGDSTDWLIGYNFGWSIPANNYVSNLKIEWKGQVSSGTKTIYNYYVDSSGLYLGEINRTSTLSTTNAWVTVYNQTPPSDLSNYIVANTDRYSLEVVSGGGVVASIDAMRVTVTYSPNVAPTITTPTKTSITTTGATLGGNVTLDGGAAISGRGVCVGTSANPAVGGTCFTAAGTTGVFTANATSLDPNTLYHYRAYATNSVGTSYTTDDSFYTLPNTPTITSVGSPTTTTLAITWSAPTGGANSYNLVWCSGSNCTPSTVITGVTSVYTHNGPLTCNTLYSYKLRALNAGGGTSADSATVANTSTSACSPTITSPTQTSIHGSDATLGGNVTDDGGATVTDRGVCVGASADPAIGGTCFTTTGTTGVFTVAATGLTQSTLYHYRAYATNSIGTSYTTDDTFTTLALNNYLVTVVSPQTAGVCATGTNTVTARDSTNTTITTDSSVVNMTSSGSGVTFYTTNGCSSSTTQYTMSSGVANIYYKTNVAQSFTITATKNGSTETGTSGSITVDPGAQTRLVVTFPGQTFTAGTGNSGTVTHATAGSNYVITSLTATDDYFNVITGYSGAKTLAYSGPSSVAGAPSYTTSVSFTSGVSTTTLNTTLYLAESPTITVTDGGLYGYASSSLTVDPGSQTRLVVTLPSQTFTAGSGNSGSVTGQTAGTQFTITNIRATDSYFNVVTGYTGVKTLAYSDPSSVAGAPAYTTSVSFTSGQSTTTLNTTLYKAETTTITVTDGGLYGYASSSLVVDPGSQTRLVVTFPGQTFTAGSGNSGSVTNQTVNGQFTITSLTATDDYFNIITGYSGAKTLAYAGPTATGGTFYTTSVGFTSGVSTTTLYTILTTAQTTTITVTDGGSYGYASSNVTVSAENPPGILIR